MILVPIQIESFPLQDTRVNWIQRDGFNKKGRKLRVLCCPANDGGCSFYRITNPYQKLAQLYPNAIEVRFNQNPLGMLPQEKLIPGKAVWDTEFDWADMKWADIVFTQNISNFGGQYTARIIGKAKEMGKVVHYDTDDLLTKLYSGHRLEKVYEEKGLSELTKFIYNNADIVTVTQAKFADRIVKYCRGTLAIVKNAIDYTMPSWNGQPIPSDPRLCRVGWAGGIHHEEDVKEFATIPHLVNCRIGKNAVRWDFYGKPPPNKGQAFDDPAYLDDWQTHVWKNYEKIMCRGLKGQKNYTINYAMPAETYGLMYSNMDVAIAPLQMNDFNDSKSEIKVAECGRYGVPLIASNVGCYHETIKNGVTGYLIDPKAPKVQWVKKLVKVIKDKKHREEMGRNLKAITDEYFDLNKVVHFRLDLYESVFNVMGKELE